MEAKVRASRFIVSAMIVSLLFSVDALSEEGRDHRPSEDAPSSKSSTSTPAVSSTPPTRQQVLVQGIREASLSPAALQKLDRVFRQNPKMDSSEFNRALDQVSKQDQNLLSNGQIQDLKKLFDQSLSGVEAPGRELSEAAKKVLQESQVATAVQQPKAESEKKEKKDEKAGEESGAFAPPGDPKAQALSGKLSPEAIDGFLKGLNAQFGKGVPAQEAGAAGGADDLFGGGALAALDRLLNRGKGEEREKGEGRGDPRDSFRKGEPPGPRLRDEGGESKKKDDNSHKLLEALSKNRDDRRNPPPPQPPPQSGGGEQKEAKQQPQQDSGSSGGESASKRRRDEEEEPKPEEPKTDLANNTDASSLLDSLKNNAKQPKPKGPVMAPIQPFSGGGGGDPGAAASAGAGMGGMGMMPMISGGAAPMMGGSDSFSGGDPFGSVGMPSYGDGGPMGGPGFSIAKEGGYVGGPGGGGSFDEGDGGNADDDGEYSAYSPASRIPTYAEQIDMTAPGSRSGDGDFLLKRYVGYTGRNLCTSEFASKNFGICEGWEAKKQRAAWWRRMEAEAGITKR